MQMYKKKPLTFSWVAKLVADYTSINIIPRFITNCAPHSIQADFHTSFPLTGTTNNPNLPFRASYMCMVKVLLYGQDKRARHDWCAFLTWRWCGRGWLTDHSSIFWMSAIMHINTSIGAVNQSALCSCTANIIKDYLTTTSTKEGRAPWSSTCKETAVVAALVAIRISLYLLPWSGKPNWRQTTLASDTSHESSQTVPQILL